MSKKNPIKSNRFVALDFFCGVGGLSHGFINSGINVLAGFDNDSAVKDSFIHNNRGASFFESDIAELKKVQLQVVDTISDYRNNIKIFAACAPCQPFSNQNKNYKHDSRKSLLLNFIELIHLLDKKYMPDFIFAENVGPMKLRGKEILERIIYSLNKMGYSVLPPMIHNAADFGVPQNRKRLIFIAAANGIYNPEKFQWQYFYDKYSVKNRVSVRDAFKAYSLSKLKAGDSDPSDPLHRCAALSDINLKRIKSLKKPGEGREVWDPELWLDAHKNYKGHTDVYGRMAWDLPSPTLTTKCFSLSNGRFGHPAENRAISLREAAILQTMRDFDFLGTTSMGKIARMIGNAVPPLLAEKFGKYIIDLNT